MEIKGGVSISGGEREGMEETIGQGSHLYTLNGRRAYKRNPPFMTELTVRYGLS